jgi:hypothetical protein
MSNSGCAVGYQHYELPIQDLTLTTYYVTFLLLFYLTREIMKKQTHKHHIYCLQQQQHQYLNLCS